MSNDNNENDKKKEFINKEINSWEELNLKTDLLRGIYSI